MAGDWIPMRLDLHDDPAVIAIALATGLDEFGVVGRLHRLWGWANRHLSTGEAKGISESWVDRYVATPGFAAAMIVSGWLRSRSGHVEFPHFDRWNSDNAKRRVEKTRQKQESRSQRDGDNLATSRRQNGDQRREEKSKETEIPPNPPLGGTTIPPELDSEDFRKAWGEWKAERQTRKAKPYTSRGEQSQLKHLAKFGPAVAIEAIRESIRNNWQGLFPGKVKHEPGRQPSGGMGRPGRAESSPGKYADLDRAEGATVTRGESDPDLFGQPERPPGTG